MIWTDEKVDILKSRWERGDSASLIAPEVGCTRNAVLGKVHRLKLSSHETLSIKPRARATNQNPKRGLKSRATRRVDQTSQALRSISYNAAAPVKSRLLARKLATTQYEEPTKNQLRAMLTQAVINTAAMS